MSNNVLRNIDDFARPSEMLTVRLWMSDLPARTSWLPRHVARITGNYTSLAS
jgi:hypothetical protein